MEIPEELDMKVTCWCGAEGLYSEMFHDEFLDGGCGGLGEFQCYCGGDFCVCHNHGTIECHGCEDCDGDEGYD